MPRTAIAAVLGLAGLAAAGAAWYARRTVGRWVYAGIRIGQAVEQERQTRAAAEAEPVV